MRRIGAARLTRPPVFLKKPNIMGVFIALMVMGGLLVGAFISVGLSVIAGLLLTRAAKQGRSVWWSFWITSAVVLPCVILLVNMRPSTINLPDTLDGKNLILNCIAYGGSVGIAVGVGCIVSLLIPRFKRRGMPPIPVQGPVRYLKVSKVRT